jgi:hypothetical protein|tara:strand:- start:1933 stop:2253 length:321 start_codon:yes stop_codon:yes gene_type:complete
MEGLSKMVIKRFNKLTEAEFTGLTGTDKFATMLSNKFVTDDSLVVEWLTNNAIGQYCVLKDMGEQWILYFESRDDVARVLQAFDTPQVAPAPAIDRINIADEFKNT